MVYYYFECECFAGGATVTRSVYAENIEVAKALLSSAGYVDIRNLRKSEISKDIYDIVKSRAECCIFALKSLFSSKVTDEEAWSVCQVYNGFAIKTYPHLEFSASFGATTVRVAIVDGIVVMHPCVLVNHNDVLYEYNSEDDKVYQVMVDGWS